MSSSSENVLYEIARDDDKEVGGVETVDSQFDALSSIAEKDQIAMLRDQDDFQGFL